jgi:hypothetical protein
LTNKRLLAEVVRNVIEGRVQLVADALHRCNRGNGNESGNQAVLDRGRALRIFNQLQKLGHLWSPKISTPRVLLTQRCAEGWNLGHSGLKIVKTKRRDMNFG